MRARLCEGSKSCAEALFPVRACQLVEGGAARRNCVEVEGRGASIDRLLIGGF